MEGGASVKAIVVPALGGPENLILDDVPEPEAGPGDLLVDVAAAGVNYVDIYHLRPVLVTLVSDQRDVDRHHDHVAHGPRVGEGSPESRGEVGTL
jgi:hypothetical protein